MLVADDLHFDMSRSLDVSLDDHAAVAEGMLRFGRCFAQCVGELGRIMCDTDSFAATTCGCFDENRESDLSRRLSEFPRVL